MNGSVPTYWQADVKSRWSDNSVRHAIISFHVDLPASTTVAVDFENSSSACHLGNLDTCQAAALDGTGMLAMRSGNWTATIEITNGSTQTANARTMINAGHYTYWLKGPVVTQMICEDLSTSRTYEMGFSQYSGSPVLSLHPQFIITAYPNYTSGIRQEFVLENAWSDRLINQTYSLAIKNGASGSNTVYSRSIFTHYYFSRWHKGNESAQVWDGTAPGSIEINHNLAYLSYTKAIPNYDLDVPVNSTRAAALVTTYNATDKGDEYGESAGLLKYMGSTGGRPEIAWTHQYQLQAVASGLATTDPVLHFIGDVSGHFPAHLREARTDNYLCATACTAPNSTTLAFGYPVTANSRPSLYTQDFASSQTTTTDKLSFYGPQVTAISVSSGTIRLTFANSHAFTVGSAVVACGYSTAAFNTANASTQGNCTSVTATRTVTAVPASNQIEYLYVGASPPADGSYATSNSFNVGTTLYAGWTWDVAHHPSVSYLPYLLTGSYYALEEIKFISGWLSANAAPAAIHYGRNYEWGIANPRGYQYRGAAWTIRSWSQAAFVLPDSSPERETVEFFLAKSAAAWEGIAGITDGSYVAADTSCPGYTAALNVLSPSSGANRNAWCFGKMSINLAKSNPLYFPLSWNTATYPCQRYEYGAYDCSATTTSLIGETWQNGYLFPSIGWSVEADQSYFSTVLQKYASFFTGLHASGSQLIYTQLGGMYTYWPPTMNTSDQYFSTFADYNAIIKSTTTTLSAAITSTTATSFTVADYTQVVWKPMWRRTSSAISSISVSSGTVQITFVSNHGLSVGDLIITSGHSTTALNTSSVSGKPITGVPAANILQYTYVGSTPPADGSYTVEAGFVAGTPSNPLHLLIENEDVAVCSIETNGVITVGSHASSTGLAAPVCTAGSSSRGLNQTTATTHSAGATVSPAYTIFRASDTYGGYPWLLRSSASFFYDYSGGSSLWSFLQTNMYSIWANTLETGGNPSWAMVPRSAGGLRITTSGIPAATSGAAYSTTLSATGGTAPYTWSIASGSLPAGLSINASTGVISGTTSGAISTNFTVRVTDSAADTRDVVLGFSAASGGATIVITPTSLTSVDVGVSVSQTFTATGGTGPYTWSVIGSSLPTGLTLSGAGILSGNPTVGGTYNFTIRATDSLGNTADQPYTWTINWLTLSITTGSSLAGGALNVAYSATLAATGGDGSYTWTLVGGVFPAGLSLNASTGEISGTPNTAANYSFTIRCTSGDSQTNDKTFTLIVTPPSTDVSFKGTRTRGMAIRCCGRAGSSTADTWDTITTTWAGTTTSWSGT